MDVWDGDGGVLGDVLVAHGVCFDHVEMGAGFDEGVEADSARSEAWGKRIRRSEIRVLKKRGGAELEMV